MKKKVKKKRMENEMKIKTKVGKVDVDKMCVLSHKSEEIKQNEKVGKNQITY